MAIYKFNNNYLDSNSVAYDSKTTVKEILDKFKLINFIDEVTYNENGVKEHCMFVKQGNMIYISYQGEAKTHKKGDLIFTVPTKYAPTSAQTFTPFVCNTLAYGCIYIDQNGRVSVDQISSTSASGRLYFELHYYIP